MKKDDARFTQFFAFKKQVTYPFNTPPSLPPQPQPNHSPSAWLFQKKIPIFHPSRTQRSAALMSNPYCLSLFDQLNVSRNRRAGWREGRRGGGKEDMSVCYVVVYRLEGGNLDLAKGKYLLCVGRIHARK
jgi:hypothetical protein